MQFPVFTSAVLVVLAAIALLVSGISRIIQGISKKASGSSMLSSIAEADLTSRPSTRLLKKRNVSYQNRHYGLLCDAFSFRNCISNPRLSSNEILYASFFCNGTLRLTTNTKLVFARRFSCRQIRNYRYTL